jgi:hypothetical protein
MDTPGEQARALVLVAEESFKKGDRDIARQKLEEAFGLKAGAEGYTGEHWRINHHEFTRAMLDMAVVYYKLGDFEQGDSLASRAQTWADDSNCSSQQNFDRSFEIRKNKQLYFQEAV